MYDFKISQNNYYRNISKYYSRQTISVFRNFVDRRSSVQSSSTINAQENQKNPTHPSPQRLPLWDNFTLAYNITKTIFIHTKYIIISYISHNNICSMSNQ